jgi:opacity protein-like surface antigen
VVGAGIDVALLPNVFVRGEWEFIGFAPVAGIRTSIHAARVGAGIRF